MVQGLSFTWAAFLGWSAVARVDPGEHQNKCSSEDAQILKYGNLMEYVASDALTPKWSFQNDVGFYRTVVSNFETNPAVAMQLVKCYALDGLDCFTTKHPI